MSATLQLNDRARRLADHMAATARLLHIEVHTLANGASVLDCGVKAAGGLNAGLALARTCLANLAEVSLVAGEVNDYHCPLVQVHTDWPVAACMAGQYAGWQIEVGEFFAMGSGPMRAAAGVEELFQSIGHTESPATAVGALETRKLPGEPLAEYLAGKCRVPANQLTLLAAPAASQAGTVQVVARSVETALHKLHELGFDMKRVVSAFGTAPLPPVGRDELQAIGRTNDAILYGGRVQLWVRGDDDSIAEIGRKTPACASPDFGEPFAAVFARYGHDFYRIDPMLFSPAAVRFCNLDTGRVQAFGKLDAEILRRSFES